MGDTAKFVSVSNNDKYSNIQSYIQSNGLEHVHVFKDIRKGRFVTPQVVFELLHRLFRSLGLGLSLCPLLLQLRQSRRNDGELIAQRRVLRIV